MEKVHVHMRFPFPPFTEVESDFPPYEVPREHISVLDSFSAFPPSLIAKELGKLSVVEYEHMLNWPIVRFRCWPLNLHASEKDIQVVVRAVCDALR